MGYKQKHPETCLAKCLMILLEKANNKKISDKYELELLIFSLKYERENIARGHLEKAVKDFKINIKWYVDSEIFFGFLLYVGSLNFFNICPDSVVRPITLPSQGNNSSSNLDRGVEQSETTRSTQKRFSCFCFSIGALLSVSVKR